MRRSEFKREVMEIVEEEAPATVINGHVSDIIVKTHDGKILSVLIERNASKVKRERVGMLNVMAKCIGGNAIIVSERLHSEELMEEVVYERHGTPVVNPETFIKLVHGQKVFIRKLKSNFVVKVNSEKLKRAREESGMSIGALANYLGVSKKSVYDYETKGSRVSVDVAARIVELYGEEVLEPVELSDFEGVVVTSEPHSPLEAELLEKSDDGVHVPKGNVHVGGKLAGEEIVAVVPHGNEDLMWFGELSSIIERKAVAVGFKDIPKELETAPIEVAGNLEELFKMLGKGKTNESP